MARGNNRHGDDRLSRVLCAQCDYRQQIRVRGREADDIVKMCKTLGSWCWSLWESAKQSARSWPYRIFKESLISSYKAQFSVLRSLRLDQVLPRKCFRLTNEWMSENDISFQGPSHSHDYLSYILSEPFSSINSPLSPCLSQCACVLFKCLIAQPRPPFVTSCQLPVAATSKSPLSFLVHPNRLSPARYWN